MELIEYNKQNYVITKILSINSILQFSSSSAFGEYAANLRGEHRSRPSARPARLAAHALVRL